MALGPRSLSAAVPLAWTVETSRATPATFEAYQGETLEFAAALQSYGKPLAAPEHYSFFWQTNGMGNVYWEAKLEKEVGVGERETPLSLSNSSLQLETPPDNILRATWRPEMDVGARVYNCFIGSPSNIYRAAFQLRMRPSPGYVPNALPLPVPVIDFAKVKVLNPPWEGIRSVDGAACPLPKYLHALDFDDSYPDEAAEYYRQREEEAKDECLGQGPRAKGQGPRAKGQQRNLTSTVGLGPSSSPKLGLGTSSSPKLGLGTSSSPNSFACSSVRSGGFLYRNFDYPFDDRAEFVVKMSSGTVPSASSPTGASTHRFASVGVAQVGTNLTEAIVTSGKPSRCYKWLPGATVDGVNENGVVCEINVVDGDPQTSGWHTGGDIHPLGAVRWALDRGESAAQVASNLAARIAFPQGWAQNFHYMVADERETWIVENGTAFPVDAVSSPRAVLTNFRLYPTRDTTGAGQERYDLLMGGASITNAWYTRAYLRSTDWPSEFRDAEEMEAAKQAWETHEREQLRGNGLWQSVHTSIYDLANRTLRVAVQETDDWYTFAVPVTGGGVSPEAVRRIVRPMISADNPDFSSAVLAVAVNTNSVEQIGELKQFFDKLPPGTVGTSLGGIVLALLGAVAWLKKRINRLSEFKSDVPTIGDIAKTLGWTGEDRN